MEAFGRIGCATLATVIIHLFRELIVVTPYSTTNLLTYFRCACISQQNRLAAINHVDGIFPK